MKLLLLCGLPMLLLRRQGVWLTREPREMPAAGRGWLRFTIADLLIATSGMAAILGLASIDRLVVGDVLTTALFAAPILVAVALAFRGWVAYAVLATPCVLVGLWIFLSYLAEEWIDLAWLSFLVDNYQIFVIIVGLQANATVAAAGVLRVLGYRLQRA